jgi:hypothetical protein
MMDFLVDGAIKTRFVTFERDLFLFRYKNVHHDGRDMPNGELGLILTMPAEITNINITVSLSKSA